MAGPIAVIAALTIVLCMCCIACAATDHQQTRKRLGRQASAPPPRRQATLAAPLDGPAPRSRRCTASAARLLTLIFVAAYLPYLC